MKTEASRKPIPLDSGLAEVLLDWQGRSEYRGQDDWLFASPRMSGEKSYSPDTLRSKVMRPAAKRAGIEKRIGWHTFRHTFATLLKANGEDVKVVQESLRHANSRITLDTGYSCEATGTGEGSQDDSANDRGFSHCGGGMKRLLVSFCSFAGSRLGLQVIEKDGRPEWIRTIDLFRVKEAL